MDKIWKLESAFKKKQWRILKCEAKWQVWIAMIQEITQDLNQPNKMDLRSITETN